MEKYGYFLWINNFLKNYLEVFLLLYYYAQTTTISNLTYPQIIHNDIIKFLSGTI